MVSMWTRPGILILAASFGSALAGAAWGQAASSPAPTPGEESPQVEATTLRAWLQALAAPELRGREAGTPDYDRAAQVVAGRLDSWGLKPPPGAPRFRQELNLARVSLGKVQRLAVAGREMELYRHFVPRPDSATGEAEGEIVAVGLGVVAPELGLDYLAGKELKGRIALINRDDWTLFRDLYRQLPPEERNRMRERLFRRGATLAELARRGAVGAISYRSAPGETPGRTDRARSSYRDPAGQLTFIQGLTVPIRQEHSLPAVEVERELGLSLAGKRARIRTEVERENRSTANILALWPAASPAAETVILAAHLDGGGVAVEAGATRIRLGAYDNASGAAVLLEVARVLARQGAPLPRHVLFAFFSAREKLLAGSRHYVENPALPLRETVAMVNVSRLGRRQPPGPMPLVAEVPPPARGLIPLLGLAAAGSAVTLELDDSLPTFSGDHWPFHDQQIPTANLHDGGPPSEDGQPDTCDRLDPERLAQAARAVLGLARRLAAADRGSLRWQPEPPKQP